MEITLDTNVLFSALIRDSITRKIILDLDAKFLVPSYIFEEYLEHKGEIQQKSKLTIAEFDRLTQILFSKIHIVSERVLLEYKEKAHNIIDHIDPGDAMFIACCLAYPDSVLWSDDKRLKQQDAVVILNTKEVIKQFWN